MKIYRFFLIKLLYLSSALSALAMLLAVVIPDIALVPFTVMTYCALIFGVDTVLKSLKVRLLRVLTPMLILCVGFYIPFQLNQSVWKEIEALRSNDVSLREEIKIPDTIAIFSTEYERQGISCNTLCQKLLSSTEIKNVLVLSNSDVINASSFAGQEYGAYSSSNTSDDKPLIKNYSIQSNVPLSDVKLFFIHHEKRMSNKGKRWYQSLGVYSTDNFKLYQRDSGSLSKIYEETKLRAKFLTVPIAYGPVGYGLSTRLGVFSKSKNINDKKDGYRDISKDYKSEIDDLFNGILKKAECDMHKQTYQKVKEALKLALQGEDSELKARLLKDFYKFLKVENDYKHIVIGKEEISIFKSALKDQQIKNFYGLKDIIMLRKEDDILKIKHHVLLELRPYIYERMVKSQDRKTFMLLAYTLCAYPSKYLLEYKNKIKNEKLTDDQIFWIKRTPYINNFFQL